MTQEDDLKLFLRDNLQRRVDAIAELVPHLIAANDNEQLGKLLNEGKQCQATLERLDDLSNESLQIACDKLAEKYGLNPPRKRYQTKRVLCAPRQSPIHTHSRKVEITDGMRFGQLRIIEEVQTKGYDDVCGREKAIKMRRFRARCDCGTETIVYLSNLRTGKTRSCGNAMCRDR